MKPDQLWDVLSLRLRSLFRKGRVDGELERELQFHLTQQTEENMLRGMPPEGAHEAAVRSLGSIAQIQEECRDMRRTNYIETIWSDVRYAARFLARTPGFTIVIVLTMALSIGANSAIFSVIEGVLLRPLPYPHAERIVRVFFKGDTFPKFPLNPFDFRDFRERNKTFDSLAIIRRADVQLSGAGEAVRLHAFSVTSGYFRVLGFTPARGREFTKEDELPEHYRSAIISDRLWHSRFSSDRNILGRGITLEGERFRVVGVMPPGVQHPGNDYHAVVDGETVDIWRPFTFEGDSNQRGGHFTDGIGRLKPGVSAEQANADLSAILSELARVHPGDRGWKVYLVPLYRETVGRTQNMLYVLLGAVGLLLLIACVNAANLLLARSNARTREIAVREAIGAGRTRIVRQLLTESLLIAMTGAALGSLLAVGGVRALVALLPAGFPRASSIHLDPFLFAFTLALAVFTGLLFGIVPALVSSRVDLQQSLREGGRGRTGGRGQLRLRNLLVIGETGLACVLLIGAGLMLRSFVDLLRADPGFRPDNVLTATVALPYKQYTSPPQRKDFYEKLIGRLEAIPGVQSAGAGTDLPWTGYDENTSFSVEGRSAEFNNHTTARYHAASPDYFSALAIPLLRGRFFTPHDNPDAPKVMVINNTMAGLYWPNENPVGKRITFDDNPKESDWVRIVGIVGDLLDRPDSPASHPAFWFALAQHPFGNVEMSMVVRTHGDPGLLTSQFRQAVRGIDAGLAVADLRVMKEIASEAVSTQRFALFLVALFAVLALVLATIGIYGVISYSVSQRMHEFGMRMALGARPSDLVRLIVTQGVKLALAGAVVGVICALFLVRILGNLLYGVGTADPVTFAAVASLAIGAATIACYIPARRATQADPMHSLRAE